MLSLCQVGLSEWLPWVPACLRSEYEEILHSLEVSLFITFQWHQVLLKFAERSAGKHYFKKTGLTFCCTAIHEASWSWLISRLVLQVLGWVFFFLPVLFSTACFPPDPYSTYLFSLPTSQVWFHRSVKIYSKLER